MVLIGLMLDFTLFKIDPSTDFELTQRVYFRIPRSSITPTSAFRLKISNMVFIIAVKTDKGKPHGIGSVIGSDGKLVL